MFEVGFSELCLIFVVALLVVGPERLPRLAHTLGLWIGKARYLINSVKTDMEVQLKLEELNRLQHRLTIPDPIFEEIPRPPTSPATPALPSSAVMSAPDTALSSAPETPSQPETAPPTRGH